MFTLEIAYRFFSSKKLQTLLIILGFGVGIAVNIFVGSLIQSLQNDLIDSTVGSQPHITITNGTGYLPNWQQIEPQIESYSEVKNQVTSLEGRAFVMNIHPDSPEDVVIRGMDPQEGNKIYKFFEPANLVTGTAPSSANEIAIGVELADALSVSVGDQLVFQTDPADNTTAVSQTISGIFDIKVKNLNLIWVITPIAGAENVLDSANQRTSIYIQIFDVFEAKTIAGEMDKDLANGNTNSSIQVLNWQDQNEQLLSGLQAQSSSTSIIQIFVLLSVVIGIASILGITVLQKSRQIGILKAMGLTDRATAKIFLLQGALYGTFGSIMGIGIGVFLLWSFNTFAGGEGSGLFTITVDPMFVGVTVLISVVAALAASLLPARTSSKMEVIDIIRNN